MGIIFNTAAILSSGLTALSMKIVSNPLHAFVLGAVILFIPIKLLLPFGSKKIISETGIIASLGVIFAVTTLGYAFMNSFIFGIVMGYAYLYWWLFAFPRIIR